MIYENGSLKRILVDGGYLENGIYHFYLQDHLGNQRVVSNSDGTVIQVNHYYPYGMPFAESTHPSRQPYKYNGKELDSENGLNWYDYGARHYDAALGRWHVVDAMAEEAPNWTPYRYAFDNPIKYIDPNGMLEDDYILDRNGKIALFQKTENQTDKLIALNNRGGEASDFIEVEKGILNDIKNSKDNKGNSYDYMKVASNETAIGLFEFISGNSQAEWSIVKYGLNSNYISTSHNLAFEAGGTDLMYKLLTQGYTVREHIHSHPTRETTSYGPSGFHPKDSNQGDRLLGEWVNKFYPSKGVKLYVYEVPIKQYIKYNHKGIIR